MSSVSQPRVCIAISRHAFRSSGCMAANILGHFKSEVWDQALWLHTKCNFHEVSTSNQASAAWWDCDGYVSQTCYVRSFNVSYGYVIKQDGHIDFRAELSLCQTDFHITLQEWSDQHHIKSTSILLYPENCQHQPSKHGRAENDGKQKKRLTRKKNYALICCFALLLEGDQHACLYNISLRFGRCVCKLRLPIIPFLWVAETLVYPQRSIFPALGRSGGSFNTRCNLILGN